MTTKQNENFKVIGKYFLPRHAHLLALLLTLLAWPVAVCCQSPNQTAPSDDKPKVVYAEVPAASDIARATIKTGTVIVVRVEIMRDGTVSLAKVTSGHPLFQAAAVGAAYKWKFAGTEEEKVRALFLTFEFLPKTYRQCDDTPNFVTPYHVQIAFPRQEPIIDY